MPTPKLTAEIITAAIQGFEFQKTSIDGKIAELRALLAAGPAETAATPEPTKRKRRKMSAAGRKAISEATKKRWAGFHAAQQAEKPALKKAAPKRKLSPARKAALVANLANARAAKAAKAKAAAKKVAPARKKATAKKEAVQTAPVKVAKKAAPVKRAAATKAAAKKTAPAAAQTAETAAQ